MLKSFSIFPFFKMHRYLSKIPMFFHADKFKDLEEAYERDYISKEERKKMMKVLKKHKDNIEGEYLYVKEDINVENVL